MSSLETTSSNRKGRMESGKRSLSSTKYKSDKIKETRTSSSPQKSIDTDVAEQEPAFSCIPLVKRADITKVLPRFTLVLSRNQEDGVGMEDLDEVQQDFEKLLSTCALRQRLLRSEVESIKSGEEKKAKRGKDRPSVKRKRIDEKPKYKDAKNVARVIKTKHTPLNNFITDVPKYEIPQVIIPKHDVSDQFWISVDPYCQDIKKGNITYLEDLFKECSQEIDFKIPDIGDHYAIEWPENSNPPEQNNGNIKPIKKNLEEKVVKQILTVYDKIKCGEYTIQTNNRLRNGLCLDKQGLLDSEQVTKKEDEILMEIEKFQSELALVNKHNLSALSKLHTVVTRDLRKQDVKAALDQVDNQVMNLHNKIILAKQKHTADMKTETAYEKYLLPKPNLVEFDQEASTIIKQQVLLHRELTDLTDFSRLE